MPAVCFSHGQIEKSGLATGAVCEKGTYCQQPAAVRGNGPVTAAITRLFWAGMADSVPAAAVRRRRHAESESMNLENKKGWKSNRPWNGDANGKKKNYIPASHLIAQNPLGLRSVRSTLSERQNSLRHERKAPDFHCGGLRPQPICRTGRT